MWHIKGPTGKKSKQMEEATCRGLNAYMFLLGLFHSFSYALEYCLFGVPPVDIHEIEKVIGIWKLLKVVKCGWLETKWWKYHCKYMGIYILCILWYGMRFYKVLIYFNVHFNIITCVREEYLRWLPKHRTRSNRILDRPFLLTSRTQCCWGPKLLHLFIKTRRAFDTLCM